MKRIALSILLLIALLSAWAHAQTQTAPAAPAATPVESLIAEAIKDIDAFSKRLDGKTLTLEGTVREIRDTHVLLVSPTTKDPNPDGIDCSFTEETPEILAQLKTLKPGMTVRITGDFLTATLFVTSPQIDFYMCNTIQILPAKTTQPSTQPATTKTATKPASTTPTP